MIRYQRPKIPASTLLRILKYVSLIQVPIETCCIGQSQLGTSWYIAMTSKIGLFFFTYQLDIAKTSQIVCLLMYQLRPCDDVPALYRTLKLVCKMDQFLLGTNTVHFTRTSGGSASLKHQLVRRYNISNTSVSFRYQL